MKFRFAATAIIAAALAIVALGSARAQLIVGSLNTASLAPTQNTGSLATSTLFTLGLSFSGVGVSDYSVVPTATFINPPGTLDLSNYSTFTFTITGYGTFVGQNAGSFIQSSGNGFLNVFVLGTFTQGPGTPIKPITVPTPSSYRISFTQTGASLSASATLASPPASVPEPGSFAFCATSGIGGLLMLIRRKRA
jgi:hypothetical protein